MTDDEMREYNDAIMRRLDFPTLLTQYENGERGNGRANVFINLVLKMLHLQRTKGIVFTQQWVVEHIGDPDMSYNCDDMTHMAYRLTYPKSVCQCAHEHWATIYVHDGRLVQFGTHGKPGTECCGEPGPGESGESGGGA